MDFIQPTPRNYLMGLLADKLQGGLDFATSNGKNKPMNMLAELLGVQAMQKTADRISYGEPLTTGRGYTTQMKPETFDAAVSVLPFAKPISKGAGLLAEGLRGLEGSKAMPSAGGNQLGAIDPAMFGLNVNKDGTVSLYHGTTKKGAEGITASNSLKSAGEPSVYMTTAKDAGYGDTLMKVDVDPKKLHLDDEFPSGRYDFSALIKNGQFPVKNPLIVDGNERLLKILERNGQKP